MAPGIRTAYQLAPGDRIGNYIVREEVGKGGWGTVYMAEHPAIRSKVAIKLLRPELCDSDESLSRFFNEARAANAIHSEHIVEVMDFGQTATGQPYFIMEWLDGHSLGDVLKQVGALPTPRALHIARQTARALAAAHKAGVIHRDLKPDNVFLQRREDDVDFVKLLDFGIAKIVSAEGVAHRTSTGQAMGTPFYMSPEQCEGMRALDWRSDIYSFGIIIYEMLTGMRPFRSEGVGALILQQMTEKPRPPREIVAGIPPAVERIVLHLLEKLPERRPQSMDDVEASLLEAIDRPSDLDGLPDETTSAVLLEDGGQVDSTRIDQPIGPTTDVMPAPPRRRRIGLVIGVAVAAIAVAGAVVTLRGSVPVAVAVPQPAPTPPVTIAPPPPEPPPAPAPTPEPEVAPRAAASPPRAHAHPPRRKRAPAPRAVRPEPAPARPKQQKPPTIHDKPIFMEN